jgi:hypothetical protein
MPQSLHDVVEKAIIVEEEMTNRGEGKTPTIPTGHRTSKVQQKKFMTIGKIDQDLRLVG